MSKIDKASGDCMVPNLELSSIPPTCSGVDDALTQSCPALQNVTESHISPIDFSYKSSYEHYVDLANTEISLKVQLLKGDGSALTETDTVGPINLIAHTLFSDVLLFLNNDPVSMATGLYSYIAYIHTLLSYGTEAKKTHLAMSGWYTDTPGDAMKNNDPLLGTPVNAGIVWGRD